MDKRRKTIFISLASLLGVVVVLVGTFFIYTGVYYHADKEKISEYVKDKEVTFSNLNNDVIKVTGTETKAGLMFYPGGKVEFTAYKPLLASLAEQGVTSLLFHMPFNLAVIGGKNKANGYIEKYPEIKEWYMMGHSLGGVVASDYIDEHEEDYKGLILLGAYPANDLSKTSLNVLEIYGSNDEVMNKEKFDKAQNRLPTKHEVYVIEGGNHSQFGMYGKQKGDGEATISNTEQLQLTTNKIIEYFDI